MRGGRGPPPAGAWPSRTTTREITVHMDGGDAKVRLDGGELVLTGPATFIATIETDA